MVEILALIPARGGSKGIPGKNIKNLGGHPLIAYSVAAAQESSLVTRTIVSTDDPGIAEAAREYGAEVPFLRPEDLAQDTTLDLPVFQHALEWLAEQEDYHPQIVVQLRPTSPFRPPDLVDRAIRILLDHPEASSVRGVVPSKQNPYKMWRVGEEGQMTPVLESDLTEPFNMPRQELPPTFWQTGHIDAIRCEAILAGSMSGQVIQACEIDPTFSVDLDNALDWERAEAELLSLRGKIVLPQKAGRLDLKDLALLVLDFDGVLTDNRVYVNEKGEESVAAHRGDGMGISLAQKAGLEVVILSKERNAVVQARADKMKAPAYRGVDQKAEKLAEIMAERGLSARQVAYIGNDINDLPCFPLVGLAICVADSHPAVMRAADLVLTKEGGRGAVREFIDMVLRSKGAEGKMEG
jgi:N-acylneuraminate cytidylyltransferase